MGLFSDDKALQNHPNHLCQALVSLLPLTSTKTLVSEVVLGLRSVQQAKEKNWQFAFQCTTYIANMMYDKGTDDTHVTVMW